MTKVKDILPRPRCLHLNPVDHKLWPKVTVGSPGYIEQRCSLLMGDWKEFLRLVVYVGNDIFGGMSGPHPPCPCWSILQAAGWRLSAWGQGRRLAFPVFPRVSSKVSHAVLRIDADLLLGRVNVK